MPSSPSQRQKEERAHERARARWFLRRASLSFAFANVQRGSRGRPLSAIFTNVLSVPVLSCTPATPRRPWLAPKARLTHSHDRVGRITAGRQALASGREHSF